MRGLALCLVVSLGVASPSWATFYWASPAGSSSAPCGNIDSVNIGTDPGSYGTIGQAARCATVAGDEVVLKAGTYTNSDDRIETGSTTINVNSSQFVSGTSESVRTKIRGNPAGARPLIKIGRTFYCSYDGAPRSYITFQYLEIDEDYGGGCSADIQITGQHVTIDDLIIYDTFSSAIAFNSASGTDTSKAAFGIVRNSIIHNARQNAGSGSSNGYAIYCQSTDVLIENNEIYQTKGWGVHCYTKGTPPYPDRATIRGNHIHDVRNGWSGTFDYCGGIIAYGAGHKIYENVVALSTTWCPIAGLTEAGISLKGTGSSATIYKNTIVHPMGHGVHIGANVTTSATSVTNNLFWDIRNNAINLDATPTYTHNGCISSQPCATTGKLTITDIANCQPNDVTFTQKSGSTCIDAGTPISGFTYNGTKPDIGATESFVFTSCQVPNGSANTIQITFTSNVHLLGSTLTTFTARRNGANNALTGAATKIGDTIVSLPVTTTYAGGDTVDWSWASGGLTDNAKIGGTINQPFLPVTNQSCTNNAGGAPTHVLTQKWVQYRGVVGPEATTDIRSNNTVQYEVQKGGAARVRFVVTCTVSNCPPSAFLLRYSYNSGPYTVVPDTYGSDNVAACGEAIKNIGVVNGEPTTAQITGVAGTFVPGAVVLSANAIPTVSGLNVGYKTELEYCVSYDTDASGSYAYELYEQNGTPLTYFQIADMLIVNPRAPAGF